MTDDELLNEHEAAQEIDCSIYALRAWRYRSEGPPVTRIGRKIRYRRSLLVRYVEERTQKFDQPRAA